MFISPRHACIALSAVAVASVGCVGSLLIDEDAHLTCATDADCPSGMTCTPEAARCVLPGVILDVTAPILTDTSSSVGVIGAGQRADVVITTSEPLASVTLTVEGEADPLIDVVIDDVELRVTLDADERLISIADVAIVVDGADAAGNTVTARVEPGLRVDLEAPAVAVDSVVTATSTDNVLFPGNAASARADSSVDVVVVFDEPVVNVSGATLVDVDGDSFALTATFTGLDERVSFTLSPGDLAGVADGAAVVSFDVEDAVNNVARRTLSSTVLIDTTRPAPPVFALLRRAPFGDEGAIPATHVEAAAVDAVVLLALPAGVTVDPALVPASVARVAPQPDGTFVVDIGIDVPGLQLVAVDAAGNLSDPVGAARTELVASVLASASPHRLVARPVASDHLEQRGDQPVDPLLRSAASVTTSPQPFWRALTTRRQDSMPAVPVVAAEPIGGGALAVSGGLTFRLRGAQIERVDVPPLPVVRGYGIATDERRGRVVLFGGADGDGRARNDLFEWDGARWLPVFGNDAADLTRPSPRLAHSMVYSAALGGVVVVNGCGSDDRDGATPGCASPIAPEVWVYDGSAFSLLCRGVDCGDAPQPMRPALTVDADGAPIAAGGVDDDGQFLLRLDEVPPGSGNFVRPALLQRFVGDHFERACAAPCADALPITDSVAFFDRARGQPAFAGDCQGTPCVAFVDVDGDTAAAVTLSTTVPLPNDFQQRGVAIDADGRVIITDRDRVLAFDGDVLGVVAPSQMAPRCGGAVAVVDDELALVGGCSSCIGRAPGGGSEPCTVPIDTIEAPESVAKSRAGAGPSGETWAVPVDDDSTLLLSRGGLDRLLVRSAADVGAAPVIVPLVVRGFVAASFSAAFDGTAVVVQAQQSELFPPSQGIVEPVLSVNAGGLIEDLCASNCGVSNTGGFGHASARTRGGLGVLFGGGGEGFADDRTAVVDAAGQGTLLNLSVHPSARRLASMSFDPEREVTWLFGGTNLNEDDPFNSPSCGLPGGPTECRDLWTFDGAAWTPVTPIDVDGFGVPDERHMAQLGSSGGGAVLSGGIVGLFPSTKTDAWRLHASSTTAPSHQLLASYAPYGPDASQTFAGLAVRWCGGATDAAGATVDVDVRAWVGGRWQSFALTADAGCVAGVLDVTGFEDTILRGSGIDVAVEVLPVLVAAGRADPTLTTTVFSLTAVFSAE